MAVPESLVCADAAQMEANKKAAMEFYEAAINKKDFDAASNMDWHRYIQHNPGAPTRRSGRASRRSLAFLRDKFPNYHADVKRAFADGDYVEPARPQHERARRARPRHSPWTSSSSRTDQDRRALGRRPGHLGDAVQQHHVLERLQRRRFWPHRRWAIMPAYGDRWCPNPRIQVMAQPTAQRADRNSPPIAVEKRLLRAGRPRRRLFLRPIRAIDFPSTVRCGSQPPAQAVRNAMRRRRCDPGRRELSPLTAHGAYAMSANRNA